MSYKNVGVKKNYDKETKATKYNQNIANILFGLIHHIVRY